MKNIFLNQTEKRLKAGWRLLIAIIAVLIASRLTTFFIKSILGSLVEIAVVKWMSRGIIVIIIATLVVWLCRRFLDKKSFVSLGLKLEWISTWDLVVGFILSGVMVGIVFLILLLMGLLQLNGIGWNGSFSPVSEIFLWFFAIGAAVGWSEELGFRGYILQNLGEGIGLKWAVIVSCVLYGVVHMLNPNSSILSGIIIALIGYLRIFGWLRTGQLWLSMGMHAGWNFFQGPIFGFGVSGFRSESLIKHSLNGPDWLTGGSFGPEANVFVLAVILLALLLMFFYTRKRQDTPWMQLKVSLRKRK